MQDNIYSFQIYNSIGEKIDIRLAPLLLRIQSYFIDLFILLQVQLVIGIFYLQIYQIFSNSEIEPQKGMYLALTIYLLVGSVTQVLYFLLQEHFWNGQTIGKRLLRLKVISANGGLSTFKDLLLRNITRPIEVGYFPLVGGLIALFHSENKRLGDILASSYVIFEYPN